MLRYLTDLSVDRELPRLRAEVNEIWSDFHVEVERGNFTYGIIRATEKPKGGGILVRSKGYGFVYTRGADGTWKQPGGP
jgi:hypothetical protein